MFGTYYGDNLIDSPYSNDAIIEYDSLGSGVNYAPMPNPTTIRKVEVELSGYTGQDGLLVRSIINYDNVKGYSTVKNNRTGPDAAQDPTRIFNGITTYCVNRVFDKSDNQLFGTDVIGDKNGTGNIIVRWYSN